VEEEEEKVEKAEEEKEKKEEITRKPLEKPRERIRGNPLISYQLTRRLFEQQYFPRGFVA
jgi:hypothetical protein